MSERLGTHRIRYRMNGLPIYGRGFDVDGYGYDEIKGYVSEPEWKWTDLTPEEQAKIETDAALLVIQSGERTPDDPLTDEQALSFLLAEYAIACPHRWTNHEDGRGVTIWRDCRMCYGSEQLPGKVYKVGDIWVRLPDPPPRYYRIPRPVKVSYVAYDPNPSTIGPALEYDEFRWNGRGYEPC